MLEAKFYDTAEDELLKLAVIISKTNGKWVFANTKSEIHMKSPAVTEKMAKQLISYKWLTEKEFIAFVNTDELIPVHKVRYADYYRRLV